MLYDKRLFSVLYSGVQLLRRVLPAKAFVESVKSSIVTVFLPDASVFSLPTISMDGGSIKKIMENGKLVA